MKNFTTSRTSLSSSILAPTSLANSTSSAPTSSLATLTMASATSSTTPSPVHSGLSKGASIGVGVGLTVAVLLIIGAMLWFFSFHKGYNDDDEVEIGPNDIDYRRKGSNLAMPITPTFQNQDATTTASAPFPTPSSSLKSGIHAISSPPAEASSSQKGTSIRTHKTQNSIDYDAQKRREGFF